MRPHLFSYHLLPRYAHFVHDLTLDMGCPFASGQPASSPQEKGTPRQLKACPLHSVPALFSMNGSHRFLQSLFSSHVLLHYACLVHMNSHHGVPFWVRQLDLFTVKNGHPQAIQSLPAPFRSLSSPQRTTALHELAPHMGCPS